MIFVYHMRYVDNDLSFLDDEMASSQNEFRFEFTNASSAAAGSNTFPTITNNSSAAAVFI